MGLWVNYHLLQKEDSLMKLRDLLLYMYSNKALGVRLILYLFRRLPVGPVNYSAMDLDLINRKRQEFQPVRK